MAQKYLESAAQKAEEAAKHDSEKASLAAFYGCISDDSFRAPDELPASSDSPRESFNPGPNI